MAKSKMLKGIKILLILMLIFILIAAFSRQILCRFLIVQATSKATGLRLAIEDLNLDIINSSLYIRGLTLFNPPGFKNEILAKAKEMLIRYDLLDFLKGKFHFSEVKANISEINIIRNERSESNVASFKKSKSPQMSVKKITPSAPLQKGTISFQNKPRFLIDRLEISLAKATFMNYQAGIGEPAVIILTIKGPYVFKGVSDLTEVVSSVTKNLLSKAE